MKTIIKVTAALFLFAAVSCQKESITTSSPLQSSNLSLSFSIGQHYGGGIIFYIDTTGQHGLIADTIDLSKGIAWWNGSYATTGATSVALGPVVGSQVSPEGSQVSPEG